MADVNPWRIIGWIVLGFLVLLMYGCYRAFAPAVQQEVDARARQVQSAPAPSPAPSHQLSMTGFSCEQTPSGDYVKMSVRVVNTGKVAVPFAKMYATVGGAPEEGYFSPATIPVDSIATADVMHRGSGNCTIVAVQDSAGRRVALLDATK